MTRQTVAEAAETTISEAISRGIVDDRLHATHVAAIRMLAAKADESVFSDKVDNVTLPTLLRYLDALGIVGEPVEQAAKQQPKTSLDGMRRKFRSVSGGRAS